mmetsp:Transcript_20439/g.39633  ORF Transcript_20439/g.39633 Transcript_20439/m.39633 type:complete len:231 (+) Transcript_20439:22-714(+)
MESLGRSEEIYATLQVELADVQSKLNTWSCAKEKELHNLKSSHTAFLDSHNDLTQQLKGREKQVKARAEKNMQEANKLSEAIQEVQAENEEQQETLKQLPRELAELDQRHQEAREHVVLAKHKLESSSESREHKQAVLGSGTELYEKYLGITFERQVKGALLVKMQNIDPSNPKRQFTFTICLEDNEQYSVSDCMPSVDRLPEMVRELNASNSLTSFVRGVRREWRAMVC